MNIKEYFEHKKKDSIQQLEQEVEQQFKPIQHLEVLHEPVVVKTKPIRYYFPKSLLLKPIQVK